MCGPGSQRVLHLSPGQSGRGGGAAGPNHQAEGLANPRFSLQAATTALPPHKRTPPLPDPKPSAHVTTRQLGPKPLSYISQPSPVPPLPWPPPPATLLPSQLWSSHTLSCLPPREAALSLFPSTIHVCTSCSFLLPPGDPMVALVLPNYPDPTPSTYPSGHPRRLPGVSYPCPPAPHLRPCPAAPSPPHRPSSPLFNSRCSSPSQLNLLPA